MKKTTFLIATLFAAMTATAKTETIKSPDGQIVVTVSDEGGKPTYSIKLGDTPFLVDSPLGLVMNYGDLTQNLTLSEVKTNTATAAYPDMHKLKQSNISVKQNWAHMTFTQNNREAFTVSWCVTDRDVAFRYTIAVPRREFFAAVVKEEKTGFVVPQGTTTFVCPQMQPMGGFAGTAPSYETSYTPDDATGKNGWGDGYTFPCLFHVNGGKNAEAANAQGKKGKAQKVQPQDGWLLISETGTTAEYCGCHLINTGGDAYQIAFPNPKEMNGLASSEPGLSLPASTPWRTITLGKTLAPIMETTIAWDLVEEQYPAKKDYRFGRGAWSWIIGMDSSCNYDEQKRYIDFAAGLGYESLLIDALWDVQIGRDKMTELVKYAASKGVGIYLWYNSNGYWNHAPQSPKGIMGRSVTRKAEFKWLQSIGVRGMKIDFFGGDKQQVMQLYEDILSDANDYGLAVIFHGCTLPRGWEKMYPNFVSAEAVRASENLHFGQGECDQEAFSATIHPFCRNTVAAMDFGGSTLNKKWGADNRRGNTRRTSDVFALATAIMFQSPVQHFAMSPKGNEEAPVWAVDFMKKVPTTWDEVRYIDGYPGKHCVMARRTGSKWYIVGINAADQPLDIILDLSAFNLGDTYNIYSDDAEFNGSLQQQKMPKKQNVKVTIPKNGGLVIM